MSSVPSEVLRDIFLPLDRWPLDDIQFTNRRFLRLIMERMSDVCLRQIRLADFEASDCNGNKNATANIQADGRPERKIAHRDTARLFSEFIQALRSARVAWMTLDGLVITPALATLVLQTPIVAVEINLRGGNGAELTPAQFQEVLLHFSPTALTVRDCQLRACQINDELIRALSKNRMRETLFQDLVPVDGDSFCVTDDALVDFCLQDDVPVGQGGDAARMCLELEVNNGSFTKNLFKRLVDANSVSTSPQPLRIAVSPLRIEEGDLHDFAPHLSYRKRGTPWQLRIYDFPGGTTAAMHLQISLSQGDTLEMVRARRSHYIFYESDE
ncbi:hypothetical protein AAVH_36625 [Aphelenchoides avenae]|nr:hypothetical protein AAVH_36625 [Aphelenchus avenae]